MTFHFQCLPRSDGSPGWRIDRPNAEPCTGAGVAHDCLEHAPDDDGSPEGEFRAMGAYFFVRGESGLVKDPVDAMQEWIPKMLRELGADVAVKIPLPNPLVILDEDIDEMIYDALLQTDGVCINMTIAHHMGAGYRWARSLYKDAAKTGALYTYIERRANELLKTAKEGDTMTVKVRLRDLSAVVEMRG